MGTRRTARWVLAIAVVGGVLTVTAGPAGASPVKGCSGKASSSDGKSRPLDKMTAPGAGGTSSDPFHVDVNGSVDWSGATTQVLKNGDYSVTVSGIDIASGSFKNDKGKRSRSGHEDVGKRLDSIPVLGWLTKTLDPSATVKVDFKVTGEGGGLCQGSVVLKIGDDPLFTPIWFVAVALFLLAFWMLFWPRGLLGG